MIRNILGDIIPSDVEPIDPGCSCGCQCTTRTGSSSNATTAFDNGKAA